MALQSVNAVCSAYSVNSIKIVGRQKKGNDFSLLKNITEKEKKQLKHPIQYLMRRIKLYKYE
jgi:hypothetical protein